MKYHLELSVAISTNPEKLLLDFEDLPTAVSLAIKLAALLPDVRLLVRDASNRWYVQIYSWGPGTKG